MDDREPIQPPVFYRIEASRVSAREHMHSGWSMAPVLVLHKVFRIPLTVSSDDPAVESLRPFAVHSSAVAPEDSARLAPLVAQLIELGFDDPVYHHVNDRLQLVTINYATLRHVVQPAMARIRNRNWYVRHPPRSTTYVEFFTRYADGTGLWSLAERADIDRPALFRMNRHVGANAATLWASHQQELQRDIAAGKAPVPVSDHEQLLAMIDWQHEAVRDHHLSRGVFAPLTDADRQHLVAAQERRREAGLAGEQHADVLAQLEKIENKRGGSWLTAIIVLVVSLLLFAAAMRASSLGGGTPPWEFVLMIIPILLFHEAGHYVAMKIFGYRNLRMFFIPMFGAAVTGQNYTAPGWKKAIVFLMGPVPGIVIAMLLGFAGFILAHPLMLKIAVLTLILNGFNLLPFLPLDGGRLMHTLIFSRYFVLDVGFRLMAALVLLLAALRFDDRILLVVAIATIVSLPAAYKMARIASDLKGAGFDPGVSPDGQHIPTSAAVVIIERLKHAFKRATSTKLMAQQTLNIYESLTARPPGIGGTLAFCAAYVASFAIAILFSVLFTVGQARAGFGSLASRFGAAPVPVMHNAVQADAIELVRATSPDAPVTRENWQLRYTIVSTFKDSATARRMLDTLRKDSRAVDASFLLFGESLLIAVPRSDEAARAHWIKRMEAFSKSVLVDSDQYKTPLRMTCVAPSDETASKIADAVIAYFQQDDRMHLIPPWTRDDARSADRIAAHEHARRVYLQILETDQRAINDPAVQAIGDKLTAANRRADRDEVKRLFVEQQEVVYQVRGRARNELAQNASSASDRELILSYPIYKPGTDTDAATTQPAPTFAALAQSMGQLPLTDEQPTIYDNRFSAMGLIERRGRTLEFEYLLFIDPFEGLPTLVEWLRAHACDEFRYEFGDGDPGK